jgi:oxygen-dependent protoporphyrinogen oxidase
VKAALEGLPRGVDWLSNARFGPGVRDILEGLEAWG